MACPQTLSGLVHDCAANMGGIKAVYLANKADVDTVTVSTNKVTAITMVSSKFFKKYEFARRTGSLSSNWQVNAENGTKFVQTDLLLVFNRMETTKRVEIAAMAAGELVAIVEDNNGVYHYLGLPEESPLEISAGDGLTGTALADRNGYSITLQLQGLNLPTEVLVGTGGVDLSTIVA